MVPAHGLGHTFLSCLKEGLIEAVSIISMCVLLQEAGGVLKVGTWCGML